MSLNHDMMDYRDNCDNVDESSRHPQPARARWLGHNPNATSPDSVLDSAYQHASTDAPEVWAKGSGAERPPLAKEIPDV
jgi:hypothetical protein